MKTLTKRKFLIGLSLLCALSFFFFVKASVRSTEVDAETPTLPQTTAANVGDWGWNHTTDNLAVVKSTDYGYTIVSNWPIAKNETNLAAMENETSSSITFNGESFYELYQQDDGYRLNAQLGYFAFSVPTVALVAENGYEYPTIEIPYGTPFYAGNYLPETTLIYKEGKWTLGEKIEKDEPVYGTPTFAKATSEFVGCWDWNHQTANPAVVKSANYGYTIIGSWEITANSENLASIQSTTSLSITFNGESFYELYQQDDGYKLNAQLGYFAFSVPTAALVAENGYEYPTIEIVNGTPFYNGNYLPETTLVYKDGAWQLGERIEINRETTFVGIGESSSPHEVILTFTDHLTWDETIGTFEEYILFDGVTTLGMDGGSVVVDPNGKTITVKIVGDYTKMQITAGGNIAGVIVPQINAYSTENGWELRPQTVNNLATIGAYGNNNLALQNGIYHTVLEFEDFFVVGNDSARDSANMAANTAYEVATKVKLNGKTFYELYQENSLFYIGYMSGGKFLTFQIPQAYLDSVPENGYDYHTLEVEEGTSYMDMLLPQIKIISFDKVWLNPEGVDFTPVPYTGVAYGWNCMKNGAYVDTVLEFGKYGVDYLGTQADAINLANLATEQIATKLTINGVSVKELGNVTVSYAHGFNYVYISIPAYELYPNKEYKCVVLHLEENTIFKNSVLSEVTLYLLNGQWTAERPTMVEDDKEGTYLTAKDIFDGEDSVYEFKDVDESVEMVSSQKVESEGMTVYNFLYKANSIDFDYSLLTHVGENFSGVKVTVFRNAREATQGFNLFVDGQLTGVKQILFVDDEWYAIRIAVSADNGKIIASVAVDGIEIIYSESDCANEVGNKVQFKKSYGGLAFADFKTGDIKKPVMDWQGKDVYAFTAGEDKPSNFVFTRALNITDNYDKADFSVDDIVVSWEEGALQNGKLIAGEWTVTISISDKSGNVAYLTIPVFVLNPNYIMVSFNVEGNKNYVSTMKGVLLEKPVDPTKASDEVASYIFDGWYVGDQKWDFANDLAFGDVELVAVFKAEYKEYTVTITSEGLASDYTYTLALRFGSTLDLNILKRAGYTYKLMIDSEEISNVIVNGDMQIKAVYTPEVVEPTPGESTSSATNSQSGGCSGSVNGTFVALLMTFAVASVVVARKLSTKGREEDV